MSKRIEKKSTVEEFLSTFEQRNLANDAELAKLVADAKDAFREAVRSGERQTTITLTDNELGFLRQGVRLYASHAPLSPLVSASVKALAVKLADAQERIWKS